MAKGAILNQIPEIKIPETGGIINGVVSGLNSNITIPDYDGTNITFNVDISNTTLQNVTIKSIRYIGGIIQLVIVGQSLQSHNGEQSVFINLKNNKNRNLLSIGINTTGIRYTSSTDVILDTDFFKYYDISSLSNKLAWSGSFRAGDYKTGVIINIGSVGIETSTGQQNTILPLYLGPYDIPAPPTSPEKFPNILEGWELITKWEDSPNGLNSREFTITVPGIMIPGEIVMLSAIKNDSQVYGSQISLTSTNYTYRFKMNEPGEDWGITYSGNYFIVENFYNTPSSLGYKHIWLLKKKA